MYKMLKENYSCTNLELIKAIHIPGKIEYKELREVIVTISDILPVWMEQDDQNNKMYWYGLLDREYQYVPELEE